MKLYWELKKNNFLLRTRQRQLNAGIMALARVGRVRCAYDTSRKLFYWVVDSHGNLVCDCPQAGRLVDLGYLRVGDSSLPSGNPDVRCLAVTHEGNGALAGAGADEASLVMNFNSHWLVP
jgi:hypothetical protein